MNSRRDFLNIALKGSAMVAATRLLSEAASASNPTSIAASGVIAQTSSNSGHAHYKPPFKFGMGGVPLGNEFEVVI
jgi:D-threo-aldose 1-dehydrogenase